MVFDKVDVLGMGLSTLGGFIVNCVASNFGSREMIIGSPRWNYYVALCFQWLLFPLLMIISWASEGSMAMKWLDMESSPKEVGTSKLLHWLIFAYMMKDMFYMSDAASLLHHLVCMVFAVYALVLPAASHMWIAGSVVLEIGSGAQTARAVQLLGINWRSASLLIMTFSNVLAVLMLGRFLRNPLITGLCAIAFATVTVGLVFMRQLISWNVYRAGAHGPTQYFQALTGGREPHRGLGAGST